MNECFHPACKIKLLWDVYLENYSTLVNRACLEHVGHAIALYLLSDVDPHRESYVYIVRRSLE